MLVNQAAIAAVFTNLRTTFNKAFSEAPSTWQKTAMEVKSTTAQNDYAALSRFPKMRKWLGDKVVKALSAWKYSIVNDEWETTIGVLRKHIETDSINIYGPMAQDAGFSARQLWDELLADLVNGAFAAECYDGQYFYDTGHDLYILISLESLIWNLLA